LINEHFSFSGDATTLFQGQRRRKSTLAEMADEWNKVAGEFGNA